jgi:hypothetical protein
MGARARGQRRDPIWVAPRPRNSPGCGPSRRCAQVRGNCHWWCYPVSKAAGLRVEEELLDGMMLDHGSEGSISGQGWLTMGTSLWRSNRVAQWLPGGLW